MPSNYGGFTMPGDDFFYLSSMYSDKLLTEFLPRVKNQAYQRYMQIQKNLLNGNEICGTLQQTIGSKYYFKESLELDTYFNFPIGSVYLDVTDQDFFYDIGDKLKFIRKFKNFNTPISCEDIIKNPDIFNNIIQCTIDNFTFNNFYIMKDKYRRIYIGIKNSANDGLQSSVFKRIINNGTIDNPSTFCFWKDSYSAQYKYSGNLSNIIFSSTATDKKRINIPKNANLSNIYHSKDNNWSLIMTYDSIRYGGLIYALTNVNLVSETNSTLSFDVSSEFINDIMSRNTVVTCIAIQKPNRKAIFAYNPNTDTEPWLALGDVDRPVSIANIKIYEYDETTNRYKRRIPIEISNFNKEFNEKIKKDNYNENLFFSNIIFPAIYQFANIKTTIRIELIEYLPNITNTTFANHIKSLFESIDPNDNRVYSTNDYLKYLTWLNMNSSSEPYGKQIKTALNTLTNYNPCNIYMDIDDYKKSGLNMREYKFGKLMQLIASDPYIYAEYIKFMDKRVFNIIRESGSPKTFKFNTGLSGDLTGTNPLVTNDEFTCVNKNDEVYFFSEPNSYITVHSDNPDAYCAVYVGGRMITPTRVKSKLNDIYIFISQNTMKQYIQEAMAKFDGRKDLTVDNLITVEIYTKIYRSTINQVHSSNIFESTSISKKIFNGDKSFKFKLSDLVIYNKITGEYVPLSKFDITAVLDESTVEFDDGTSDKIISRTEEVIYLGTVLNEFYMTKDNLRIILEENTIDFNFPSDDSQPGGRKDNYKSYRNKTWYADELKFKINEPKLAGTEIEFVYSPVAYEWNIPFDKFTKTEDGMYTYKLGGFITNNDISLYDLYINGEYLDPSKYLTMPDGVSTDDRITITLPESIDTWYTITNKIIQLRYNPSNYMREYGTKKYLISDVHPLIGTANDYTIYNLKDSALYECIDVNHYFNSDNSKVFIYKTNKTKDTTALMRPYTWKHGSSKIDLQELTGTSILHPMLIKSSSSEIPVLRDLDRDKSFITNSKAFNARSIIDQITL